MCSSVQKALFEEEDHVKKLQQKVATLEKRNKQLRERVKKVKRSLRQARKNGRHLELLNRKLSEKLAAAAGALPHINALGREPAGAPLPAGLAGMERRPPLVPGGALPRVWKGRQDLYAHIAQEPS